MNQEKNSIVYLSPLPPPYGGLASWTEAVLEWAEEKNREITVVNTAKIIDKQADVSSRQGYYSEFKRTRSIIKKLNKQLENTDNKIFHLNSSGDFPGLIRDYIFIKRVKRENKKVILQFHCDIRNTQNRNQRSHYFHSKMIDLADQVWVLNQQSYKAVETVNPTTIIKKMPNFIEEEVVNKDLQVRGKVTDIGYLGRVSKAKGIEELFELAKMNAKITFHLIGPVSDEINQLSIPENVHLYGSMERKEALEKLSEMDVYLSLSHTEGFSISLLEAMAQGLPVIATAVGANQEIIVDEGGFIVDNDDYETINLAIAALHDENLRNKYGKRNVHLILDNYTKDSVLTKMFKEYEGLIQKDHPVVLSEN